MSLTVSLTGELAAQCSPLISRLGHAGFPSALASGDATLWGPEAVPEASIRLGWVQPLSRWEPLAREVVALREELAGQGITRVVLCGMGGSSLGPEVMAAHAGVEIAIVDSTHPDSLLPLLVDTLAHTTIVVSSKSGGTLETDSARRAFEAALATQGLEPRDHLVVVTDPDSPLHHQAIEAGYRVFLGDPTIGGRFSALSPFGLVPAGLAGVDILAFLEAGEAARLECLSEGSGNPALILGCAIAVDNPEVDKLLLSTWESAPGLGDWIEQLVAESTGKGGLGILPVVGYGLSDIPDGLTIGDAGSGASVEVSGDLAGAMMLWECATAVACHLLGVNPFDQPNVESAKVAARGLLEAPDPTPREEIIAEGMSVWSNQPGLAEVTTAMDAVSFVTDALGEKSYLALCIFGPQSPKSPWWGVRDALEAATGRPVTLGFGPRFLHSTGQLHKGGPAEGVFLQVIEKPEHTLAIPGRDFDFGQLLLAQAHGDADILAQSSQPVVSITVDASAKERLMRALKS